MVRGLRSRGEAVHLTYGIWYHKALENYDKYRAEGVSHDNALHNVVLWLLQETWDYEAGKPWDAGHAQKTRESLVRTVIWYLEQFGDRDPSTTVVLQNGRPAVELSFRLQVDDELMLCGHLDRVVEFQGNHYVMDRKTTTTTISSYYFDQYTPDNQMSLYTFAGGIIYESPLRGVIIDAAQVAIGFSRFERAMVYRTEAQLTEWLADAKYWTSTVHRFAERQHWPQNDKSCHKYGGCPFRSICATDPRTREAFVASNFDVAPWNPLENR